jgi:hypothetical protein
MGTLASVMLQMFLSLAHEKSNYSNSSPGPGIAAPIGSLGTSQLSNHKCAHDFDGLAQRESARFQNPCQLQHTHSIHRACVQPASPHSTAVREQLTSLGSTAWTTRPETDTGPDDTSLAREVSMRYMYVEHASFWAFLRHTQKGRQPIMHFGFRLNDDFYCAGHILHGGLGCQV